MGVLDQFRLDGRVAVVTGASKNIGLEIARAFAEAGATVVAVARTEDLLEERARGIRRSTGGEVVTEVADVRDRESTDDLVERVHARFDQVDVLVNNAYAAGNTFDVPAFEIPERDWEETIAGNIMGPYRLSAGFGRRMLEGRGGSIINVLSGSGFQPSKWITPYGTTKAALWMMTRYLANEVAPTVRVNALCPGLTMSETGGPALDENIQRLLDLVPMGRAGYPEEVAPAALYLASDAARYTTGALLMVNGGRPW